MELETEIYRLKLHESRRTQNETSREPDKVPSKGFEKKCNICHQTFKANSDFEKHMVDSHEAEKTFNCEVCGKTFLLSWRLRKHATIHTSKPKVCHFFSNNRQL